MLFCFLAVGLATLHPCVFDFYIMASAIFTKNPVLDSMNYANETLILKFKKRTRTYINVPINIGYGLFYSKTPLKYFNENIKKKYKVIDVK